MKTLGTLSLYVQQTVDPCISEPRVHPVKVSLVLQAAAQHTWHLAESQAHCAGRSRRALQAAA